MLGWTFLGKGNHQEGMGENAVLLSCVMPEIFGSKFFFIQPIFSSENHLGTLGIVLASLLELLALLTAVMTSTQLQDQIKYPDDYLVSH